MEVRGWTGWHHHNAMCLLAMLFLLQLKVELGEKAPMISIQDAKELLEFSLPRKEFTLEQLLEHFEEKHKRRYSAKKSHSKKKNLI